MKASLMTMAGWIMMAVSIADPAAAAEQVITPAPLQRAAAPNQPVAFTVGYGTANPCLDQLTGLGLRIHWDSSRLAFASLSGVLPTALVAQGSVEDDTANADGDALTDKFLQVAWADVDAVWPGGGCTTANLFTANFNVLPGMTDRTVIRFSASSTAAGFDVTSVPAVVMRADLTPSCGGWRAVLGR